MDASEVVQFDGEEFFQLGDHFLKGKDNKTILAPDHTVAAGNNDLLPSNDGPQQGPFGKFYLREGETNDVRGLYGRGIIGLGAEVGRPGVSCNFRDVETVTMALAKVGMKFAEGNPVTANMVDRATGKMDPEILGERVMSAIVEGTISIAKLADVIKALREVAQQIDTVFSLDLIDRPEADRSVPMQKVLDEEQVDYYPNGKFNLGLGRPLVQ